VGRSIAIAVVAAVLSLAGPLTAHAAGLGKLTVLSPLGQPLNAEIEIVSLQKGEDENLSAKLASPDAFKQAGIEYNSILASMRFAIERRGGRPVLKVTSSAPVNEPFLDLLVELQWNTGRLVREYTFLLDPVEYKGPAAVAAAPAPAPAPAPAQTAAPAPEPQPPAAAAEPAKPAPIEAQPIPATPAPASPSPAAEKKTYEVKKGDTLGKIARDNLAPGITLDQMLIAIFRANQDAFIRDNINLVRAGRILNIPEDAGTTVDNDEARRIVGTHRSEFTAYRNRLAAAPAAADGSAGQREVAGRIEAKPAAPAPQAKEDQLRLSKTDPAKPGAVGTQAAREDDRVARERALKEAQSRQAELEKNVTDLQKLLELKNQQLAELEKKAGAKPVPVPAPAPKAAEPAKPVPAPAPKAAEAPKAAPAPAPTPAPAPAAKAEPAKPAAEVAKPAAEAPKPAAEAPKPAAEPVKPAAKEAPKPAPKEAKKAAPAPAQEPSLIDEFLDNPAALGGLGFAVLVLIGYGAWAWRRKKRSQSKFQDSVLDAASGAGAASVFGAPAASSVASSQASVSQAPAGMEAEEVDPIAEADVYMAYGRDAQAEEILKEAIAKDASRVPVHAKLLEIYANRKDAKSFEQTALKLKGLTNGAGPEWDKAAALGRGIDPQNGLYGGAAAAAAAAAAPVAVAAPVLDFDLGGASTQPPPDIALDAAPKDDSASSIDFDLGAAAAAPEQKSDFTPEGTLIMGKDETSADKSDSGLDFDLGLGGDTKPVSASPPAPAAPADTSGGLDFDLNLDMGSDSKDSAPAAAPSMDLSSISLDLGDSSASSAGGADPKWQEVATKLDLAKAYEEMGDKDGARELLNEVVNDGDAAQKGQAQQLLAKLG
jgi:pilus assembly protein FimV